MYILNQMRGWPAIKLSRVLWLMAALLLCAVPAFADTDQASAVGQKSGLGDSNVIEATCKGLQPFNNIDELLYQFYINLDSDCLFIMPVEELEQLWDIKILSTKRAKQYEERYQLKPGEGHYQLGKSSDFEKKPYKTDKDAFYVHMYKDTNSGFNGFYIMITKDYDTKYGTLFPKGNFPELLPTPLSGEVVRTGKDCSPHPYRRKLNSNFLDNHVYYWLNSDKTTCISTICICGVDRIGVNRKVLPEFYQ